MKCPHCEDPDTCVIETRESSDSEVTRRRRECNSCEERFTTYERVESPTLKVEKRDGTTEPFRPEKLAAGIEKAFKKRPVDEDEIAGLVDDIEMELRSLGKRTIQSSDIGDAVVERIREMDEVAYIRFASIYNEFDDVSKFEEEVQTLKSGTN